MKLPLYQVDAFAERRFEGNPAAVCPLEHWLDDALMQSIATENNLSETAFLVPQGNAYALRWFTPAVEVDLCGHATLAAAHVLLQHLGRDPAQPLVFHTRSGPLTVTASGDRLLMDFPARPAQPCEAPGDLVAGLGRRPREVLRGDDYLAVFDDAGDVLALRPDLSALMRLDGRGVIATAPGDRHDFVSRFFAPKAGVPEDPVTGSAHCTLTPYWAARLGRTRLRARQVSARGGDVDCEFCGDRVRIAGRAVTVIEGTLEI